MVERQLIVSGPIWLLSGSSEGKGPRLLAHTHNRACTHTHTARARTTTPTVQHPDEYLCTNACSHARTHARTHTKHITTKTRGHAQTVPATHSHSLTHILTHAHTHTRTHARTQVHMYTHPRSQTKTHTTHSSRHAYTDAHASLVFVPSLFIPFIANPRFSRQVGSMLMGSASTRLLQTCDFSTIPERYWICFCMLYACHNAISS